MSKAKYDDFSLFLRLPEEIVLEMFNKLIDLKTLCLCTLVSRRFKLIVHQVHTISFTWNNCSLKSKSFLSAVNSIKKFRCVKCLYIELPYSTHKIDADDDNILFKWKINFGKRLNSFLFLSVNSVRDTSNEEEEEEEEEEVVDIATYDKYAIECHCLRYANERFRMLLDFVVSLPLLEKVSITDSSNSGKVYASGGKIAELRNWLLSNSPSDDHQTIDQSIEKTVRLIFCYFISKLKLPVSRCLMKGVTFYMWAREDLPDEDDPIMKLDDDEIDYEDALVDIVFAEVLVKTWGSE